MPEYISRDAALIVLDWDCASRDALNAIKAIPAADVVEVVRCYECIYWEHRPDRQYDLCAYLIGAKRSCNPEDFCSRGKRKDGGQDDA